jgi:hypothetical protein
LDVVLVLRLTFLFPDAPVDPSSHSACAHEQFAFLLFLASIHFWRGVEP